VVKNCICGGGGMDCCREKTVSKLCPHATDLPPMMWLREDFILAWIISSSYFSLAPILPRTSLTRSFL